ncbi:MAG: SDR family oxidoreductase [Actinomycetota bacterium]
MSAPDRPLDGLRALVVGGGSGIGLASARLLARVGATVTLAGRTESKLAAARDSLATNGAAVTYTVCDALDGGSVSTAVDAASDDDGRLHIAVVVPGRGRTGPVLLADDDDFSSDIDANVRPVFLTLKYAGRAMLRAGSGSFVAISSTAAIMTSRFLASYCAGKAAVDQLVRVAADELGEYGIRVNGVRPGLTRTATTAGLFDDPATVAAFLAEQPLGRSGEASDIAAAVRHLAGPESSWTTGQLLTVDGGNTLRSFIDYRTVMPIPDVREVVLATGRSADSRS